MCTARRAARKHPVVESISKTPEQCAGEPGSGKVMGGSCGTGQYILRLPGPCVLGRFYPAASPLETWAPRRHIQSHPVQAVQYRGYNPVGIFGLYRASTTGGAPVGIEPTSEFQRQGGTCPLHYPKSETGCSKATTSEHRPLYRSARPGEARTRHPPQPL